MRHLPLLLCLLLPLTSPFLLPPPLTLPPTQLFYDNRPARTKAASKAARPTRPTRSPKTSRHNPSHFDDKPSKPIDTTQQAYSKRNPNSPSRRAQEAAASAPSKPVKPPKPVDPNIPKFTDPLPFTATTQPTIIHHSTDFLILNKPATYTTSSCLTWAKPLLSGATTPSIHPPLTPTTTGLLILPLTPLAVTAVTTAKSQYHALVGAQSSLHPKSTIETTHYRIVSRSPTLGTLLLCTPTALPQKILPHLASFNSPVLGDPLHTHTLHLTTPRPLLHHSKLSLETPTETLTFTAPLPNDMTVGKRRDGLRDTEEVTAFREVNGEGDGVSPTLLIDRYGDYLFVQRGANVSPETRNKVLSTLPRSKGVYETLSSKDRSDGTQKPPRVIKGDASPEEGMFVAEHGVKYYVKLCETRLSTGLFLDQRDARAWMLNNSRGKEVLNLFAHGGGYSVAAAVGGAKRTVSVDMEKQWLDYQGKSLEENGIGNKITEINGEKRMKHDVIFGDCFQWMKKLTGRGEQFDVVVLDPPSTSLGVKGKRWSAAKDYTALVSLAAPLVKEGGVLWTTTNSRKVLPEKFAEMVRKGLPEGSVLERVVPVAVDFPVKDGEAPGVKNLVWRLP